MVKFRNIKVKMPGGGSRIQRAMVLASGKLKFVKNKARSTSRSAAPRQTTTKRRIGSMAKKRRGGSRGSLFKAATKIAEIGALTVPAYVEYKAGGWERVVGAYTGYSIPEGKWHPGDLVHGWGPFIGLKLGEKAVAKINGILRTV